jgi:hypothetical protein
MTPSEQRSRQRGSRDKLQRIDGEQVTEPATTRKTQNPARFPKSVIAKSRLPAADCSRCRCHASATLRVPLARVKKKATPKGRRLSFPHCVQSMGR